MCGVFACASYLCFAHPPLPTNSRTATVPSPKTRQNSLPHPNPQPTLPISPNPGLLRLNLSADDAWDMWLRVIEVMSANSAAVSGAKWLCAGATPPPTGRRLENTELARALTLKTEFSQMEWNAFGISDLHVDDFIQAGERYFKPAGLGMNGAGCLTHLRAEVEYLRGGAWLGAGAAEELKLLFGEGMLHCTSHDALLRWQRGGCVCLCVYVYYMYSLCALLPWQRGGCVCLCVYVY